MTNYFWTGVTGVSANNANNWIPVGIPAAGDVAIFDASATIGCSWDIPLPASAFSVDEIIIEDSFIHTLTIDANVRLKGLFLNGTIVAGAANKLLFEHGASPNFFGSYKTYNERFVLIGDNGDAGSTSFEMQGSATPVTKFDDGQHPTVDLTAGNFAPDYTEPTGTSGKASFDSFTLTSPAAFAPDGDLVDNDRLKVFSFKVFSITSTSIDYGLSAVEYYATASSFEIPTKNNGNYGLDFEAYYRKIVLKTTTAGWKCVLGDNTFLSVEEFEIDDGVVLKGAVDDTSQGSEIRSIKTPKIRGTWSFSQVSQGIYRSPRHAPSPMLNKVIEFDTANTTDVSKMGEVRFEENEQTLVVGTVNGLHAHLGQTFQYNVKNQTGGLLTAGTVVMAVGTAGSSGRILVDAMDASATGDAHLLVGVLQEDVINGADSAALALGKIKGINVTALKPVSETWVDGDVLYCDQANDGGLTNVRPSSGIILPIAFIIKYASNGTLAIRALPIDEGATGGGGGTPAGSNTQVQFNDGGSFGASADLTWDDTAKELYVDGKLTVTGLIDPTGLELAPQAANPGGVAGNTLWMDSLASNRLKQGSTKVIQAGDPVSDLADDGTYATAAQGALADTALQAETDPIFTASEANLFAIGDAAKLAGIASGATAYTDSDAIAAVEGEADLVLSGDVSLAANKELTINESTYAALSKNNDDTKVLVSADSTGTNDAMFRIDTDAGFLRMGPQNTGYCHFYTDRAAFYFNRNIEMDGGSFYAYNDDLQIKTDDSGSGQPTRIFVDAGVDPCRVGIGNGFSSSNLPATELEVAGTIRQSNATSAVLVADANGDITAATNLSDQAYLGTGQAETDMFTVSPPGTPTNWAGLPPNTIGEAINRIAAALSDPMYIPGTPIP